jgi:hypothetical protein
MMKPICMRVCQVMRSSCIVAGLVVAACGGTTRDGPSRLHDGGGKEARAHEEAGASAGGGGASRANGGASTGGAATGGSMIGGSSGTRIGAGGVFAGGSGGRGSGAGRARLGMLLWRLLRVPFCRRRWTYRATRLPAVRVLAFRRAMRERRGLLSGGDRHLLRDNRNVWGRSRAVSLGSRPHARRTRGTLRG